MKKNIDIDFSKNIDNINILDIDFFGENIDLDIDFDIDFNIDFLLDFLYIFWLTNFSAKMDDFVFPQGSATQIWQCAACTLFVCSFWFKAIPLAPVLLQLLEKGILVTFAKKEGENQLTLLSTIPWKKGNAQGRPQTLC